MGNAAQIESATAFAAQQFTDRYIDPITINIQVVANPGTSILGESTSFLTGTLTYAQVRTDLTADATSASDATAVAGLGVSDPTGGGSFRMTTAQGKALGTVAAHDPASDGTFTFGEGFTYTFDPLNRAVVGAFDFIGLAEHEISEIMGRIPGLGSLVLGTPTFLPHDLFRYT